jgi:hypothetical protein
MAYYNKYLEYPLNLIYELGEFPWRIDLKLVEEHFDSILNEYFKNPNCFLTSREQTVLLARFKEKRTLEEIGKEFDITRERVRQIERKAICKLNKVRKIFYTDFDEYLAFEKEHISKTEQLKQTIVELDKLIDKANYLIHNDDTTIREIKEFLDLTYEQRQEVLLKLSGIEDLDLSIRSYNCLRRAGIETIEELTRKTIEELMKIRNLGRKSLKEIRKKLEELGIELREE